MAENMALPKNSCRGVSSLLDKVYALLTPLGRVFAAAGPARCLTGFPVFATLEVTLAAGLLASANRACRATAEVARNTTVALAVFPGVCT